MMDWPTVETERLVLRGWRTEDFEHYAEFAADPEVARFLGGVQSREDAWRSMAMVIGHWVLRGFGFWAVERKSDGAFVGRVGLWQPEGWPGLEVGWTLARPFWGHGYATEAALACRDYGFRTYPVDRLVSLIAADNVRSQAVAGRIGEIRGAPFALVFRGETFVNDVWEITRERWQGLPKPLPLLEPLL